MSVLIPSRGRPEKLSRCLKSLGAHRNVEILIGIDDDDGSDYSSAVRKRGKVSRAPRSETLGICINQLAARAKGNLLFFLGDDNVFDVADWPDRILAAAAKMPEGIGVLYPRDPYIPGFASLPIISRRTYDAVGHYMSPLFPFWFIDTWWNEVGQLLDAKFEIDLEIRLPDGKGLTHGLTDLYFWADFFEALRPLRVHESIELAKLAYGEGTPPYQAFLAALPERRRFCGSDVAHLRTPGFIENWQGRSDAAPSRHYERVRARAESLMAELHARNARFLAERLR